MGHATPLGGAVPSRVAVLGKMAAAKLIEQDAFGGLQGARRVFQKRGTLPRRKTLTRASWKVFGCSVAAKDDVIAMDPKTEAIARLAYRFYVEDGKPEGRAKEHWARAEEFLRHPENHSEANLLAVPSEPEIDRALDEKARDLDLDLPSDPHSGRDAVHQRVEIAIDRREKRPKVQEFEAALKKLPGIERVELDAEAGRVRIFFDARRTNPAAIHEAITDREEDFPED
jgi:hypothetical protein